MEINLDLEDKKSDSDNLLEDKSGNKHQLTTRITFTEQSEKNNPSIYTYRPKEGAKEEEDFMPKLDFNHANESDNSESETSLDISPKSIIRHRTTKVRIIFLVAKILAHIPKLKYKYCCYYKDFSLSKFLR